MLSRRTSIIALTALSIIALGLSGCSDNSIVTVLSEAPAGANNSAGVARYFPLNEGYTTTYEVTYSNKTSEIVCFKVGKEVSVGSLDVVEWLSYGSRNGPDTGYFRVLDSAIYYYENLNSTSERILQLPLEPGYSWSRFATTQSNQDDFTDIITDIDLSKDDTASYDEQNLGKTFPSGGGAAMTVAAVEPLELKNGDFYSHAVKVYSEETSGIKKNYYWYAANIGLVKYVVGATDESYPDAEIVGELINSGY